MVLEVYDGREGEEDDAHHEAEADKIPHGVGERGAEDGDGLEVPHMALASVEPRIEMVLW